MAPNSSPKLEIDWLKTAGGAFAAVSSAVLLSTLGAAGTIIGAALGSVIVTVGGAFYTQGLARSQQRLSRVQNAALRKVRVAQADVRRAARNPDDGHAVDEHLADAAEHLDGVRDDLDTMVEESAAPGWRERLAVLPWKRISLIAAGLFVAAILTITAFELVAGRSVSSITGGTDGGHGPTIGRVVGDSGGHPSKEDEPAPPAESPSEPASIEPSQEPAPTGLPTSEPTVVPDTPVPTASTTPDEAASPDPAATPPAG